MAWIAIEEKSSYGSGSSSYLLEIRAELGLCSLDTLYFINLKVIIGYAIIHKLTTPAVTLVHPAVKRDILRTFMGSY
ncbi:MAG: hypothetical protein LBD73_00670 [Deferribacteraceae bacterium]|jgi:hypothetical protein|nr:hypothetical protein [Deferribacteraceae bacterium]